MMDQWMSYFSNPKINSLKKVMFEVLRERFAHNEQIVERIGHALTTQEDMNQFLKLVTDVYEIAYLKAVSDHRAQLEKAGFEVTVIGQINQESKEG